MELELSINGVIKSLDVAPQESLLTVLRREGYYSIKHGCETGECGACTVLVDGIARPGCVTLAVQAGGCTLTTVESLQQHSPNEPDKLHPLQEAFIDTGAVQCGFCTPGMLLSASALLKRNPSPSEAEVREALSGNLCRCSGYVKPVQAVLRAAAVLRGEAVEPLSLPADGSLTEQRSTAQIGTESKQTNTATLLKVPSVSELSVVGKSVRKADAVKLVTGKPAFTDDLEMRDMLTARILTSPHAHAIIRSIDVSEAQTLPGVHAVLTYQDVQRIPYTSAGHPWTEAGPRDQYVLDNRVRFVGDRVAAVAAETPEIAEQALKLIQVDYEVLPAVLDPRLAISTQAPRIHPEPDSYGIQDAGHNIAAYTQIEIGDVEAGFAQADLVVENEYLVPQVQTTPLETHSAITYWDENERLVIRTSAQNPAHVRRIIAPLIGLPPRRIRVIKPQVGSNVGTKQDLLIEDLCALLTIATRRPVRLEYSRVEEFRSGARHAQIIHLKTGVTRDGKIVANAMQVLAGIGAYGTHALTAPDNTGCQTLPLYPCPNLLFEANVVYTNLPPADASLGDGAPQGFFALESQMDEIARQLGMDALELRRRNWIKVGDTPLLTREIATQQRNSEHMLLSCGLAECLRVVEEKLQWKTKRGQSGEERLRRGVGLALAMHSNPHSKQDLAGATLKLNEDGSFHLLVDTRASGSETIIAQAVAEIIGTRIEDILIPAVDTDVTPFATGSDVSSVGAAMQAARQVRTQILAVASQMLQTRVEQLVLQAGTISTPGGQSVTISQVATHALTGERPQQIIATASWTNEQVATAFAAQGVEVEVDMETGVVLVKQVISAIDAGHLIHPLLAEGHIEGGVAQALGYSLSEEMLYDQRGSLLTTNLSDYRILNASDMPRMETCIVTTDDPAGPFGAKSIAEIPLDALAPAVANAVADALGVRLRQIPLTPERVLRALRAQAQK